jgi:hypothetical protein
MQKPSITRPEPPNAEFIRTWNQYVAERVGAQAGGQMSRQEVAYHFWLLGRASAAQSSKGPKPNRLGAALNFTPPEGEL